MAPQVAPLPLFMAALLPRVRPDLPFLRALERCPALPSPGVLFNIPQPPKASSVGPQAVSTPNPIPRINPTIACPTDRPTGTIEIPTAVFVTSILNGRCSSAPTGTLPISSHTPTLSTTPATTMRLPRLPIHPRAPLTSPTPAQDTIRSQRTRARLICRPGLHTILLRRSAHPRANPSHQKPPNPSPSCSMTGALPSRFTIT